MDLLPLLLSEWGGEGDEELEGVLLTIAAATAAAFATEAAKSKLCLCALALLSKLTSSLRWWLPNAAFFSLSKVMRSKVGGCWGSKAKLGGSGSLGYSSAAFLILRSTAWSVSSGLIWLLLSKVVGMAFLGEDKSTGSCCTVVLVMFYMSELFDSLVRTEAMVLAAAAKPNAARWSSVQALTHVTHRKSRTPSLVVRTVVVKKKTNLTQCCCLVQRSFAVRVFSLPYAPRRRRIVSSVTNVKMQIVESLLLHIARIVKMEIVKSGAWPSCCCWLGSLVPIFSYLKNDRYLPVLCMMSWGKLHLSNFSQILWRRRSTCTAWQFKFYAFFPEKNVEKSWLVKCL